MKLPAFLRRTPGPAKVDRALHRPLTSGTRQVVGNFTVRTDGAVWAGYLMGGVPWDFKPNADKGRTLDASIDRWAGLAGRDVRERVTPQPHDVAGWAAWLDEHTPRPLPDVHWCGARDTGDGRWVSDRWGTEELQHGVCGCETWDRHLTRQQQRIAQLGMHERRTFRHWPVGQVDPALDFRAAVLGDWADGTDVPAEVRAVFADEARVRDVVTRAGWRGRRMTEVEEVWLRRRSLAPGVPAPALGHVDPAGFANDVRWSEDPFDRTVGITAFRGGRRYALAAQVLTLVREDDHHYPENGLEPWQVFGERVRDAEGRPFSLEWFLGGRVYKGAELTPSMELMHRKALHLRKDYKSHGEEPHAYVGRGIKRASQIVDEVATGQDRQAARYRGTINVVVTGEDVVDDRGRVTLSAAEVAEARGEAVRTLYAESAMRMPFTVPLGQWDKLRETVTGEDYDREGFQRQVDLGWLAAGYPNVSSSVGDGFGSYLGPTRGAAATPVKHDSHYATEGKATGRDQNLWLLLGTLGAGKTVALCAILYNAARRGVRSWASDPSGRMYKLCELPELAPFAMHRDLANGADGILNPPSMVREPGRAEFPVGDKGDEEWRRKVRQAAEARRAHVRDIARRCLEGDLYEAKSTPGLLREAADAVPVWTTAASLWDLRDVLTRGDRDAQVLARALSSAADMPGLNLFFPPRGQAGDFAHSPDADRTLVVTTTRGVKRAPDGKHRSEWTPAEVAADPLLYSSSLYLSREIFEKDPRVRGIAAFDEAENLLQGGAGRSMADELGRDHSKINLAVYLLLKNLTDEMFSGELRNFVAGMWAGRMASEDPARRILSTLHIEDPSYAKTLMGLSVDVAGEFVELDADGRVGAMRFDVDYYPPLAAAVKTDPDPDRVAGGWSREEALA